jgi:hypothetical protein
MDTSCATECPSRETLQAFVDEELAQEEHAHVASHVEQCDGCQCTLEQLNQSQTVVPASTQQLWQGAPPESVGDLHNLVSQLKKLAPPSPSAASRSFRLGQLEIISPSDDPQYLGMIGPYGIVEVLGHGGMGVVLKAVDTRLDRTVAIKTLLPDPLQSEDAKQRFLREARSAAALRHDHVVTIHAIEERADVPYIVMEYIRGRSLAERIAAEGPLPPDEVARLGAQAAAGLAAAHAKGLIHRDIKPANLLIDEETGRLKITDFGLARLSGDVSLTQTGMVAGTPEYMSPEQADGRPIDHRADLFSMGTVLYAALTGKSPFSSTSVLEALRRVREAAAPPISGILPAVPPQLADVIDRLMAKAPADRIQSAGEVAMRLSSPANGHVEIRRATAAGELRPSRVGRKFMKWIAAAGALLLAGIAFWRNSDVRSDRQGDPPQTPCFRIVGQERTYTTLADAVTAAGGDDVIEVFGNEVFAVEPIQIEGKPLTIRAAPGHHPVLSPAPEAERRRLPIITTDSRLELEGLELRWHSAPRNGADEDGDDGSQSIRCAVLCQSGELNALNCRFHVSMRGACVGLDNSDGRLVNCHILSENGTAIGWRASPRKWLAIVNSRLEGRCGVLVRRGTIFEPLSPAQLHAEKSTFQTDVAFRWMDVAGPQQRVACRTDECLFQSSYLNVIAPGRRVALANERTPRNKTQALFHWSEGKNVYARSCEFLAFLRLGSNRPQAPEDGDFTLADWLRVWRLENAGSTQLQEGEEPPASAGADPLQTGPGKAYELFRASVAYPQWKRGR